MKSIYKGGQFQTGDFAQILTGVYRYYDCPESIKRSIHSTNLIERMNKEIRRRIKIIDSLPSEESAMKIMYLRLLR